ncbi:MAG: SPOR domain-containing protein [Nitrospinae bacterium]|nr:SPOR domain-containing protein [Nitrospinota bacterium]
MIADILKYFSSRLALSYILFGCAAFGIMYSGEGRNYPQYFLYILFLFCFAASSVILSRLGKWRFNALMVDAQECDITRFFKKGEILFEKLLVLTNSFHFLPHTAWRLRERVFREYSRFLLALDVNSEKALLVHKKALTSGWDDPQLKSKLVSCFMEKNNLEREEVELGLKLIPNGGDTGFIDLLAENCLTKNFMDYDAQEVYRQAIETQSKHVPKILDQILPGVLNAKRKDPFALMLYFNAVERKHKLAEKSRDVLMNLAQPYLLDKDLEGWERRLVDFYRAAAGVSEPAAAPKKSNAKGLADLFPEIISRKKGKSFKKEPGELQKKQGLEWRAWLPDTTFLYITAGVLLVAVLGYQSYKSYKEKPSRLEQVQETPAPAQTETEIESKPAESRKYVPFQSTLPFTIQVGAYNSMEKAEDIMSKLRKGCNAAVYWLPARIGGKVWYRVRVGEFPDQESARLFAKELEDKGLVGKDYYLTNFQEGFILGEGGKEP